MAILTTPLNASNSTSSTLPARTNSPPTTTPTPFKYSTTTARANNTRPLRTASCLIIGDEVLNGKIHDTNSFFLSRLLFSLSISLVRIETIPDSTPDIIASVRRLSSTSDLVITSGGIGPTHDDITYASIAEAFGLRLKFHEQTWERMKRLSKPRKGEEEVVPSWDVETPALEAKRKMVRLPWDDALGEEEQAIFPCEELWVPVNVVNGNVYILPGIPRLFEQLLEGLRSRLASRVGEEGGTVGRIMFSTPMGESHVAAYLMELSERVAHKGIKVGSYPRWGRTRNTITLVGQDTAFMESLVEEVERNVRGKRVTREDEADTSSGDESNA